MSACLEEVMWVLWGGWIIAAILGTFLGVAVIIQLLWVWGEHDTPED